MDILRYNRPRSFQSVITSYLREYTWCDVVKEGYSHQYNFIRIMLKLFIHIHNVTLLFNLPLVNYLYLGTTFLSHVKKITIHFLWPRTHNCIPGSFYFEWPLSAKASHSLVKLIVLHIQGLRPTFLLPLFYDCVRPSCLQKSPCHGVSTAIDTSTYFLFSTNVRLQPMKYENTWPNESVTHLIRFCNTMLSNFPFIPIVPHTHTHTSMK